MIMCNPLYASAFLRHRVAAGVEHKSVLKGLGCNMVIDIGANVGQFALVARSCFPKARIISFEPLPRPIKKYQAVFYKDKFTTLYQEAIGPNECESTMHLSQRDDSSSLLAITSLQEYLFPGTAEICTVKVNVGPLSNFLSQTNIKTPSLLKLDVQGYELQALRGCEDMINCFMYVYVECSFIELYEGQALADEVIAWLRHRNFRLIGVYNISYSSHGQAIQADFLFTK